MTKKAPKYTEAMVAAIVAASKAHGVLDAEKCAAILSDPAFANSDITHRGVIAKVRSMQLPYAKAERLTKSGDKVMTKEEMAEAICAAIGVPTLKSLAKAEKLELRALLAAVQPADEANEADEAAVG